MSAHSKPKGGALVPGIFVANERGKYRVRATAVIEGRQRFRTWSLTEAWTFAEALEDACSWRFRYAPGRYDSAETMLADALTRARAAKLLPRLERKA